jgi:hypothetical protein
MTKEEYKTKKAELTREHNKRCNALDVKYATDNNKVKHGDLVKDHLKTIKVDTIRLYSCGELPTCIYSGVRHTQRGEPFKREQRDSVVQLNLETINNKKVEY